MNCLLCGKEFETTQRRLNDGRGKFCSSSCAHRYIFTEKNPRKKDRIARTCLSCGNLFYVTPYYSIDHPGRPARRFCSRECEHAFHTGERNGKYKDKVERICEVCGKHFFIKQSYARKIPYRCCSNKCMGIWRRETGIAAGKNNPGYVDGSGRPDYNENFFREIRPQCLEYHGLPEDSQWCIHHIDYNSKNDHPLNLIPLPRRTHGKTNHFRKQWKYFFLWYNKMFFYFVIGLKKAKFV